MNSLYCQTFLSTSEFGETSELYPKSSCLEIDNVETTGRCFMGCLNALEVHYMFSYDEEQAVCVVLIYPDMTQRVPSGRHLSRVSNIFMTYDSRAVRQSRLGTQ